MFVNERTDLDVNAEFAAEVGVELTHGVPAILAHSRTVVHAEGCVTVVDEGSVETCQGLDLSIEQAQIDIDVAPGRGTDHDTAFGIGGAEQRTDHCGARAVDLLDISPHISTLALVAAEELRDLRGYRRQSTIVGQFVAQAEVSIGSNIHGANGTVELEEGEGTTFVFCGFADVEMPLRSVVGLIVLSPGNLELDGYLELTVGHVGSFGSLAFFRLRRLLGIIAFLCFAAFVSLIVAGQLLQPLLRIGHHLIEVGLVQTALELVERFLHALQLPIESGNLFAHFLGVGPAFRSDVQAEIAILRLGALQFILVHHAHLGTDDASYCLHFSIEHEGRETVGLAVVGDQHIHVRLESLLASRSGHRHSESNANIAVSRFGVAIELIVFLVLTGCRLAVEVEAATDAVDDQRIQADARFALCGHQEVSPGKGGV